MRSLLRMQHHVLAGTRRLFRATAAAELRAPTWLITRGAQHVTDADTVAPEQSALWDSDALRRWSCPRCGADSPI